MSPFQFGAALATLAGALVALSARDIRLILAGLVVTLGLAPVLADPLPSPIALAARLVAALLGAELILVALRGSAAPTRGAALGPVSLALAAAAAGVVGYATSGVGSPAVGPPVATAVGFGLVTIALGPLVLGRDVLRIGLGMTLLVAGAELIRTGLAGTPGPLEQGALAGLTIAILGATATIAVAALASGHNLSVDPGVTRETLFEAHRLVPTAAGSARGVTRGSTRAPGGGSDGGAGRRPTRGRAPAAGPRRDAAAHQLTLEERLRLTSPAEGAGAAGTVAAPEPAPEPAAEPAPGAPAEDPTRAPGDPPE